MAPRRDLHWPSLAILATGLLSVGPVGILAQTSTAVCLSSYNWVRRSALFKCFALKVSSMTRCSTARTRTPVLFQRICKARAMVAVRFFPFMSCCLSEL